MSSNTKWTAGSLAYIDALCKTHHQPTYSEMAAALMALTACFEPYKGQIADEAEAWEMVYAVVERLRLIGADE